MADYGSTPQWALPYTRTTRTATQAPSPNYAIPSGNWPTGSGAGAGAGTPNPTAMTFPYGVVSESALRAEFMAKYPYMAAFMDHPEVGAKIREAAANGWGVEELRGAIMATRWFQTTSASQRTYDALRSTDPAEAAAMAAETAASIQNRARSLGIPMSSAQIMGLAVDATRNGWTEEQTIDRLIQSVNFGSVQGGQLTAWVDMVKAIGGEYLVRVSDSTAQSYALAIASGEMTEAGVTSVMQAQARARFGWMADQIDQGVTPSQYFMPIRDTIAAELEIAPETVNMMDSQYLSMIEVADEQTGQMRGATLREAQLSARRDERWRNTQNAANTMSRAANNLAQAFGRRVI